MHDVLRVCKVCVCVCVGGVGGKINIGVAKEIITCKVHVYWFTVLLHILIKYNKKTNNIKHINFVPMNN